MGRRIMLTCLPISWVVVVRPHFHRRLPRHRSDNSDPMSIPSWTSSMPTMHLPLLQHKPHPPPRPRLHPISSVLACHPRPPLPPNQPPNNTKPLTKTVSRYYFRSSAHQPPFPSLRAFTTLVCLH